MKNEGDKMVKKKDNFQDQKNITLEQRLIVFTK